MTHYCFSTSSADELVATLKLLEEATLELLEEEEMAEWGAEWLAR
jgi:hypothetical protein